MPWFPDLFSAPALERIRAHAADARAVAPVPYFAGVATGETEPLIGSFAGEPELHHPIRGRVKGRSAFEWFVAGTNAWLTEANVVFAEVRRIITPRRGVEETYQAALAAGDAQTAAAAFEPDGYLREPAGRRHVHRGRDQLVAVYELFFSNGGGIPLEHCSVTDDGRSCALEYNVVSWGRTELPPQAGIAVYTRGPTGKLASAHIYDDADPPLGGVAATSNPAGGNDDQRQ